MKKQLLLLVMMLLPMMAMADAVEIDGIFYDLKTSIKEAEVTYNPNKYTGSIVIPETITYNEIVYSVTGIGSHAFEECSDLTSITIPNSVTKIWSSAFADCTSLTSIHLPNSVTIIGDGAFAKCSSLTSISIPNSVTNIGGAAFYYCSSLTSVTIPNSVTSIGRAAFYGCTDMNYITIGSGLKTIEPNAFANCPKLRDLYCWAATVPNTDEDVFYDSYTEKATLHVLAASIDSYKAAVPWKYFKEIVALTDSDPNPTAIKKIEMSNTENAVFYDLNGRRVEQPQKGLYIKNGKKYVVK